MTVTLKIYMYNYYNTVPIKTHHKKLGVYVKDGACLECVWTVDCAFVSGGGGGGGWDMLTLR